MDWAQDQLGKLIDASQSGIFSFGLFCPTCGEPVRKRVGTHRRPHFAHYSYSAKPECENYHPSRGTTATRVPGGTGGEEHAMASGPSLSSGLFLGPKKWGGYSLYLKLPQLPASTEDVGGIEIHTGLGVRHYRTSELQRPRSVPVIPQLPIAKVMVTGDLGTTAMVIRAHVDRFLDSGNYFYGSESGGRLLVPEEPLEWGESYRLLTQWVLGPVLECDGLQVTLTEKLCDWYVYEITLPTLAQAESKSGKEALSRDLGRMIRAPRAHVYFVDPPPHHIEPDGTYVFPATVERITLRRTGSCRINIRQSAQVGTVAIVTDLADEWVEITGIGTGDFTVLLDDREELLGRMGECDFFKPRGVGVSVNGRTWELFEPELRKITQSGLQEDLLVECPSLRVAEHLSFAQPLWVREGAYFTCHIKPCSFVDAGNFGALTWPVPEQAGIQPFPIDTQTYARRAWLEGLVLSLYGADTLMHIRKLWDTSLSTSYYESVPYELSDLYPHIQFARFW